jgi:hypothetical protein
MDLTALVPKDILDLLSAFLPNRRADVARLRAALAADDWAQLQHLSERLYALGNPYGFRQITTFGRLMREACGPRDEKALERLIHAYAEYLSKVVVVEVDAPVTRLALSAESRSILVPHETVRLRRKHAVVKGAEGGASKPH